MRISMYAKFQILQNQNGNLIPLGKNEIEGMSIGGYYFTIKGKSIPFYFCPSFSSPSSQDCRSSNDNQNTNGLLFCIISQGCLAFLSKLKFSCIVQSTHRASREYPFPIHQTFRRQYNGVLFRRDIQFVPNTLKG